MRASLVHAAVSRGLPAVAVLAGVALAGVFGLSLVRAEAERGIYRDRLREVSADFDRLAAQYNQAIRKTAVTELVVADGRLTVVVRNLEGTLAEIETPYDPSGEIYVDYAVLEGRVWIRRVFDMLTPPASAIVIDPKLAAIDWDDPRAEVGKAVYRSLSDGRWVVTVSGSGSLGLRRTEGGEVITLAPPPLIAEFEEIEAEARRAADGVTLADIVERALGR
jgi:hypothetical protein